MAAIARRVAVEDGFEERQYRILYAEDQASSRTVTTAMLKHLGYHVDAVEDGERALELARENAYDIILLDIEMPIMDGVTAARMIRAETNPCQDTPILALSAFIADTTEQADWRGAFDSALPKPANGQELKKAVSKALHKKRVAWREVTGPDTIIKDLQAVLPHGAWGRLVTSAAAEMNSLAITLSACLELQDQDNAQRAARALYSLARNFGAADVAALANSTAHHDNRTLLAAISAWRLASA